MKKIFAAIGVASVVGMLIAAVVPPSTGGGGGSVATLTDVDLGGTVNDGDSLVWDDTAGVWTNTTVAGAGDMTKAVYDADDDGYIDSAQETNSALEFISTNTVPGVFVTWDAMGDQTTVGPGIAGYVLTSDGAGLAPSFQALPAAGGESVGTVHATGTPAANELMMAADTTGTNLVPSGIKTDGSGGQTNTTVYTDELVATLIDGTILTNIPHLEVTTGLIIPANSIALATTTTGNYVATIADSGASEVTVANSGAENAAVTLALAAGITRDTELTANTNLLHLNTGTLTATNQFKTLWKQITLDGTNAVLDLKLSPNFYWSTTTSNYLTFSNITAGAQGSILIYTPDSGGEQINFTNRVNNLSTNRYAPVFQSTNQTWIGYSVTFGTDETNVTVGISVK